MNYFIKSFSILDFKADKELAFFNDYLKQRLLKNIALAFYNTICIFFLVEQVRELHRADGASVVNASCKAAYCDRHTPVDDKVDGCGIQKKHLLAVDLGGDVGAEAIVEDDTTSNGCADVVTKKMQTEAKIRSHELMKVARRTLAMKRSVTPVASLPGIPRSR